MSEKCANMQLSSGAHAIYIEAFQGGGGVGLDAKYSGPDTGYQKVLMNAGKVATNNLYYQGCNPTGLEVAAQFTMCIFKNDAGLSSTPAMGTADAAGSTLHYVGKSQIPVIDLHDLSDFRSYVANTPVHYSIRGIVSGAPIPHVPRAVMLWGGFLKPQGWA